MILPTDGIMLLLIRKMYAELKEYEEDYAAFPKWYSLASDKRFAFMQEVYENACNLMLTENEIKALLPIDGILDLCWDIWYEYRCPISCVLMKASFFAMNGVV